MKTTRQYCFRKEINDFLQVLIENQDMLYYLMYWDGEKYKYWFTLCDKDHKLVDYRVKPLDKETDKIECELTIVDLTTPQRRINLYTIEIPKAPTASMFIGDGGDYLIPKVDDMYGTKVVGIQWKVDSRALEGVRFFKCVSDDFFKRCEPIQVLSFYNKEQEEQ